MPARDSTDRLVVVSNRLPFDVRRTSRGYNVERSPGGLVAAVDPVVRGKGGTWVGWPGIATDDLSAAKLPRFPASGGVAYRPVPLSAREVTLYYGEFSNRTIWPLFHYFVGRTKIDTKAWHAYDTVNERFAKVAAAAARRASLVWVHDYHLLRVPLHLRRHMSGVPIAFFLHIPFPSVDVYRVLPWARQLLRGVLAADLVGFQVPTHVAHFLGCAERLLGCEVDQKSGIVHYEGRDVAVQAHPISIDFAEVERLAAARPPAAPRTRAEVLGVDRLDYTKGIPERLAAIERFLERHPGWRRHFRFTQVLVPSRERVTEYRELKRQIDETVGRINGRFSEQGWTPIRYLVGSLPPDELAVLYRNADVGLVTPLRDGMNLVAKEFVAAHPDCDGVLILSEMAGAAEELHEAVQVNPFDVESVADALHHALSMPDQERRARMSALRDRVRQSDVHSWTRSFLEAARAVGVSARGAPPPTPADLVCHRLAPWLSQRTRVALFLDYDGTLTPIVERPEHANLGTHARDVLEAVTRAPHLDTVIVSGRALGDLKPRVGLDELTYVGNHGFEIEGPGTSFRHEAAEQFAANLAAAAEELTALSIRGAEVEHKGLTITFHVRRVRPNRRAGASRAATAVLKRHGLALHHGHMVLEGRPAVQWNKGTAVLHFLEQRYGPRWMSSVRALYIGDDRTDEDAFRSLRGMGRSIWVGQAVPVGGLQADYRLPGPTDVLQLVSWLAAGAFISRLPRSSGAGG